MLHLTAKDGVPEHGHAEDNMIGRFKQYQDKQQSAIMKPIIRYNDANMYVYQTHTALRKSYVYNKDNRKKMKLFSSCLTKPVKTTLHTKMNGN